MNKQMEKLLRSKHPDEMAELIIFKLYFEKQPKLLPLLTYNSSCPPVQESSVLLVLFPSIWTIIRQYAHIFLNLMTRCSCSLQPQRLIWTCALNNLALTAGRSRQVVLVCLLYAKRSVLALASRVHFSLVIQVPLALLPCSHATDCLW